jgi:glutathione S-transferase
MNLYFSPLACSLATRIALYETKAEATFTQVDLKHQRVLSSGQDFGEISRMRQVPVLILDDGTTLTENTALLQYVAEHFPAAQLAPTTETERAQLKQWLGFIGTELHKAIYAPLLSHKVADAVREYAREQVELRFGILEDHFATHEFALEKFSVADIYLIVVLNWSRTAGIDLKQWPSLQAYSKRMLARPSVARACGEELTMFQEQQLRHAS